MSSGPYIHLCGLLAFVGIPGLKWPASKGAITIDCSAAVAWARISFLATILYIYIYIYIYSFFSGSLCRRCHWCRRNFSWCCCLSMEGALIPPHMVSPRKPPKMVQSMEDLEVALPGKLVLILWTLLVHLGGLRGNFSWCCCLSAEGALIPPNMVSPRKPPKMVHSMEDLDVALPGHCPSLIPKHDES